MFGVAPHAMKTAALRNLILGDARYGRNDFSHFARGPGDLICGCAELRRHIRTLPERPVGLS